MKKATVGFLAGAGSAVIMGLSWYATKRISQISGAYVAVTGKASTEYCDRICDSGVISPEEFSRWLKES